MASSPVETSFTARNGVVPWIKSPSGPPPGGAMPAAKKNLAAGGNFAASWSCWNWIAKSAGRSPIGMASRRVSSIHKNAGRVARRGEHHRPPAVSACDNSGEDGMQVHFDVPEDVAQQFAAEPGGITRASMEALAIEGVRSGKLSVHQ